MRPSRVLLTLTAAALLAAGCATDTTSGSGAPAASPSPSGNGVADLTAEQILARSKAALQGATSVRIKGSGGAGSEKFDLDMRYSGTSSVGTISAAGQPVELRRLGPTVYLKGGREFWVGTAGEGAAELLAGKWLKSPLTDKRFADLAEITDLDQAASGILEPDGKVSKGQRKTIDGTAAIGLTSGGDDGTLYVATTGEPYPLQIESTDPKDPSMLSFADYGKPVTVETPAADTVIDVTKLPGS